MLTHAFDTLGCNVVGWRTDDFNYASQRAIERLGAKRTVSYVGTNYAAMAPFVTR
ncbi:GNAT family N-acetyltransferase [Halomonas sp. PAMB 3264]|uniref:GNAT family N-acetyltransferase n=1 Tax=Halomonas sp. PAMB 3264 TaxID=3075222 RepID=UPI003908A61E